MIEVLWFVAVAFTALAATMVYLAYLLTEAARAWVGLQIKIHTDGEEIRTEAKNKANAMFDALRSKLEKEEMPARMTEQQIRRTIPVQ